MIIPNEKNSPAMQRVLALLARKADMSASDLSREAFVGVTTLACGGCSNSFSSDFACGGCTNGVTLALAGF